MYSMFISFSYLALVFLHNNISLIVILVQIALCPFGLKFKVLEPYGLRLTLIILRAYYEL